MNNNRGYEVLIQRNPSNPILTAQQWPYPVHTVFNPGATRLRDGTTLLLARCEDRRGFSHLCAARSDDGVSNWRIDSKPTFEPDPEHHLHEIWGVEDPRITYLADRDIYAVAYTAFSKNGPGVALALTSDFVEFERLGLIMQPDDKDAALFPHPYANGYALVHRPASDLGAHLWISYSPDLFSWGQHQLMLPARRGAWWDANKVGLSPPPIETPEGWLIMYHGVRQHASGSIYRLGLALFELENPGNCLLRGQPWMMTPEAPYELQGDVPNVIFPGGFTIGDDKDTVNLYYGASDSSICHGTASIKQMLNWIKTYGTEMTGVAGLPAERSTLNVSQ